MEIAPRWKKIWLSSAQPPSQGSGPAGQQLFLSPRFKNLETALPEAFFGVDLPSDRTVIAEGMRPH